MPSKPSPKGDRRTVRIGKYEVLVRLPSPDGAAVYRATDAATGKEVSLRILPPDLVARPGVLDRLRREADKVRRLRHENLLALLELGEDHRTYFLVHEFAEGSDLATFLQEHGKFTPEEACRLLGQAARALGQAHARGILHGRLHPGSFLITGEPDRPVLKLTDLGPALDTAAGPVTYLAPEQIRDRTPADGRTDLYALGCALFHMLAGQPPFPDGPAEQRLQRDPPDVRALNDQVTPELAAVQGRLMARKVEDRYEDVPALLEDLDRITPPDADTAAPAGHDDGAAEEDPMAALAALDRGQDADEVAAPEPTTAVTSRPRAAAPARLAEKPPEEPAAEGEDEAPKEKPARRPSRALVIGGAVAGGVVLLGIAFVVMSQMPGGTPRPRSRDPRLPPVSDATTGAEGHATQPPDNRGGAAHQAAPGGTGQPPPAPGGNPSPGTAVAQEPPKLTWPALYTPKKPLDFNRVLKEFEGPWAEGLKFPQDAPVFHVSRLASTFKKQGSGGRGRGAAGPGDKKEAAAKGKDEKKSEAKDEKKGGAAAKPDKSEAPAEAKGTDEPWFDSLAAACAAVPEGQPTVIEINDNGPLFEPSIALTGRRIMIRAAPNLHPLIVWDVGEVKEPKKAPAAFLTVTKGQLLFGLIDLAVRWPDPPAESVALLRMNDSDLLAWGSAFSVETRHPGGIAAVRCEGSAPGKRCRLSRCLARGEGLAALDVRAPAAEVLFDDCLLVGGTPPLLHVEGRPDAAPTLRVVRCTLVSGQTLLELRPPSAGGEKEPALHWMAWDTLLARSGGDEGGTLVDLPAGAPTENVQWRVVNCLYAGWKTLLGGSRPIDVTDLAAWHERWHMEEGDAAIPNPWNAVVRNEPAEVTPEIYTPVGTPMAFKASFGDNLLGCNLAGLPVVTDTWPQRTVERFPVPSVEVMAYDGLPPIPQANDGKFYGARLDLDQVDLGEYLRQVQKTQKMAARVTLLLRGTGERKMTPVRFRGASLLLCFEPPADPKRPLVLVPDLKSDPLQDKPPQYGVIQVEGGDLDLIGVGIRCPDFKTALVPPYLLVVQGGSLRIHRSRLQGPVAHPPAGYWGLIRLEGLGRMDAVRGLTLNQSLLLSGRVGVHVVGFGWRGRALNSVVVAGTDAFHFQPTPFAPYRLNTQLMLERTTVAAKRGVVHVEDVPRLPLVVEPVVVQTKGCAFENPFAGPEGKGAAEAGMVRYGDEAVPRGLLCWQGEGDAFDPRLQFYALRSGGGDDVPSLAAAQQYAMWNRLWGPLADRGPLLDLPFKATLDPEKLGLEALDVPGKGAKVGADLVQLGIKKK